MFLSEEKLSVQIGSLDMVRISDHYISVLTCTDL